MNTKEKLFDCNFSIKSEIAKIVHQIDEAIHNFQNHPFRKGTDISIDVAYQKLGEYIYALYKYYNND